MIGILFLVWALIMLFTGQPVPFTSIVRPRSYSKPIYSEWFRIAGGIYVLRFILTLIVPDLGIISTIFDILASLAFLYAIFKGISPKVF